MNHKKQMPSNPWLLLLFLVTVIITSAGCSSSEVLSNGNLNPLAACTPVASTPTGTVTDGTTQTPGAINQPIVSVPENGSASIAGHGNAPLLDNKHPGWQQEFCMSCHSGTTRNPDHYYTDTSMCYLCHGTNGLPGFADEVAPVISGVTTSTTPSTCTVRWRTDEPCIARLKLKTPEGDKITIPATTAYETTHKYVLKGLASGQEYTYELIVFDKSRNSTSSSAYGDLKFKTQTAQTAGAGIPGGSTGDSSGDSSGDSGSDSFFSNYAVKTVDAYSVSVKCSFASPVSGGTAFLFREDDFSSPDDTINIRSGSTNVDLVFDELNADTSYTVQIKVKDSNNLERKTKRKTVKTDPA